MSRKLQLDKQSDKDLHKLSTELQISIEPSKYAFNAQPTQLCLYEAIGNDLYVPFAYNMNFPRPERSNLPKQEIIFTGHLRPMQEEIRKEAIKDLNRTGSTLISLFTGGGKTCLAINIATKIKLKTLILCHRIVLINQWKASIQKFCPNATIQVLTAKSQMKDVDFYIINATNVYKHPPEFYKEIGVLLVDEAHLIMAEKLSKCMYSITPRYVIGLTATPYRMDGLNILLDMYFGKNKIVRKLYRKHTVYRVDTGFKPTVKLNRMGKVDWGSVLESQCDNVQRNELIIKVIKYFPNHVFLILCKRVNQANYLYDRLVEEKEDVTSLIGSQQTFEQSSRILVGTCQKAGVGFDHPRLNALLLASDVEQYFIQYLGRVFRTEEGEPLIFDFVDDYSLLLKHYRTRSKVYTEHGGIIKDFWKTFPKF